ncbi:MAG: hypothetical protein ACLRM9_10280 [Collinsella aerofaciens]
MADVDNRNRNRRTGRAGQPNPKREARAKAAERHVATVSKRAPRISSVRLPACASSMVCLPVLSRR